MSLNLYLAHPFDERKNVREWELGFEERTGIKLVNPFYDVVRPDVEMIDSGRADRYKHLIPKVLVERDLNEVKKAQGTLAFITGAVSYGTIMEIVYSKLNKKPVYTIISNGHENHPWLIYHSDKILKNKDEFENWITKDCDCGKKMVVVGRNIEQMFDMYECFSCNKTWLEVMK